MTDLQRKKAPGRAGRSGAFGMLPRAPFGEERLTWGGQAARGEFRDDAQKS